MSFSLAKIFTAALSKHNFEALELEPLKGMLFSSRILWIVPSSPNVPCKAMKTKSNFLRTGFGERYLTQVKDENVADLICDNLLTASLEVLSI